MEKTPYWEDHVSGVPLNTLLFTQGRMELFMLMRLNAIDPMALWLVSSPLQTDSLDKLVCAYGISSSPCHHSITHQSLHSVPLHSETALLKVTLDLIL